MCLHLCAQVCKHGVETEINNLGGLPILYLLFEPGPLTEPRAPLGYIG